VGVSTIKDADRPLRQAPTARRPGPRSIGRRWRCSALLALDCSIRTRAAGSTPNTNHVVTVFATLLIGANADRLAGDPSRVRSFTPAQSSTSRFHRDLLFPPVQQKGACDTMRAIYSAPWHFCKNSASEHDFIPNSQHSRVYHSDGTQVS